MRPQKALLVKGACVELSKRAVRSLSFTMEHVHLRVEGKAMRPRPVYMSGSLYERHLLEDTINMSCMFHAIQLGPRFCTVTCILEVFSP